MLEKACIALKWTFKGDCGEGSGRKEESDREASIFSENT
jgi:hypothetical protein